MEWGNLDTMEDGETKLEHLSKLMIDLHTVLYVAIMKNNKKSNDSK